MPWLPYFSGDIFLSQSWVVFFSKYTHFNYLIFFLRVLNLHFFDNWIFVLVLFYDVSCFCGVFGVYFMFYTQSTFTPKHSSCLFLVFFPFYLYLWFLIILFVAFSFVPVVYVKIKYLRMFNQCNFVTLPFVFAIFSLIFCWTFYQCF